MSRSLYQNIFFRRLLAVIVIFSISALSSDASAPKTVLNKRIKIDARGTAEIPLDLTSDARTGIAFFVSSGITASLLDSGSKDYSAVAGSSDGLRDSALRTFFFTVQTDSGRPDAAFCDCFDGAGLFHSARD